MSLNLQATNFSNNNRLSNANTVLTADIIAGVASLPVANSNNFSSGGYVLIGAPGSGNPEMLLATAPSGATTIPLSSNTTLQHNNNDPVRLLFGNQVQVYSAPDSASALPGTGVQPPDTAFSPITGSPFNIDASSALTFITDPNGIAAQTWYKFTYYNSSSEHETSLADSNAILAGQIHYVSLDQVRSAAGFDNNTNVLDSKVAEFRDAAEKEVNGALLPVYAFPLPLPTNPIIVEITKNIAAGELKHELYQNVSASMAKEGEEKADKARNGGGSHTSLQELVYREVVLTDAQFNEETVEEAHAFGGWPDETTNGTSSFEGGDHGSQFKVDEIY